MSPTTPTRGPRRRAGVRLSQAAGDSLLTTPEGETVAVNDSALALWELSDGETTVEEMVVAVDTFFDADSAVIRRDVEATLAELVRVGVLDTAEGPVR